MNYFSENSDPTLQQYLRTIAQYPLISMQRERELADLIEQGDRGAYWELVRSNLRLVVKIAKDFTNLGLPLLDLISEGNLGLMKAAKRFNPARGGKMSTYGAFWIKQSIKRALANQSKMIRLPIHLVDKLTKIRRVADLLTKDLGREATHEEIAQEIGMLPSKVAQLKLSSLLPLSLEEPIDDERRELGDIVKDELAVDPFEQLKKKDQYRELSAILDQLDGREKAILTSRFGLDGSAPITLEEIGKRMGVTRERIRQLQKSALLKIRSAFEHNDSMKKTPGMLLIAA